LGIRQDSHLVSPPMPNEIRRVVISASHEMRTDPRLGVRHIATVRHCHWRIHDFVRRDHAVARHHRHHRAVLGVLSCGVQIEFM
jgi:hypothetical protein